MTNLFFRPLLLTALLASASSSQDDKLPKWLIDPYTKNKPELMQKAGYVSFGPFRFGNLADKPVESTNIQNSLEWIQILWLETAHFRIGVNLSEWPVPLDAATRGKIRQELEELAQKLPGINPKTRTLDRWLRAHLTAHRLEKLYAETSTLFGVKDADFPTDATQVMATPGARYMGYGPYLGMKDKYLVLVFDKCASHQAYMKAYLGRDSPHPQRWHFKETSSILITLGCDSAEFPLKHDTALHCGLAFNVSQNLMDGFRYYAYDLPVWIREGFGHWNWRRIDPKWPNFDQNEGAIADIKMIDKWEPYCRGLLGHEGKFASFPEAMGWRDFGKIAFNDHVAIWSRMDWLLSQGPEKWQKFLWSVKGRVDANWSIDQSDLVGATREALQQAYGVSVLEFDRKWAEWVRATYPAQ
jgi:hypothetical protein